MSSGTPSTSAISKYLVQYVAPPPPPKKNTANTRVTGSRVLTSAEGYAILREKEEKKKKEKKQERIKKKQKEELAKKKAEEKVRKVSKLKKQPKRKRSVTLEVSESSPPSRNWITEEEILTSNVTAERVLMKAGMERNRMESIGACAKLKKSF